MSDFSQLCPLFNTGVYSELSMAAITFSGCSTTMNALGGIKTRKAVPGSMKFDRTVIVTKVFGSKQTRGSTTASLTLVAMKMVTSGTAAMTAFASLKISATNTVQTPPNRIRKLTQASNKTFLAADVLGFSLKTKKANAGKYNFIVRYKEK